MHIKSLENRLPRSRCQYLFNSNGVYYSSIASMKGKSLNDRKRNCESCSELLSRDFHFRGMLFVGFCRLRVDASTACIAKPYFIIICITDWNLLLAFCTLHCSRVYTSTTMSLSFVFQTVLYQNFNSLKYQKFTIRYENIYMSNTNNKISPLLFVIICQIV